MRSNRSLVLLVGCVLCWRPPRWGGGMAAAGQRVVDYRTNPEVIKVVGDRLRSRS